MTPEHVTLPLAFVAGLLSFLSPCVLPLVPAYVGYLGGATLLGDGQAGKRGSSLRPLLHALVFVLGFSAVFIALGASATFLGRLLFDYRMVMARVGGAVLVVFGLRLMGEGWSRRGWIAAALVAALVTFLAASGWVVDGAIGWEGLLYWLGDSVVLALVVLAGARWGGVVPILLAVGAGLVNLGLRAGLYGLAPAIVESLLIVALAILANRTDLFYSARRLELKPSGQAGLARSLLFGVVFAAGWTPCLGPILALILGLASQLDTVGRGILLLAAYSLGLGIPFLLVGLAFGPLAKGLRRLNRYAGVVSVVSGGLLVLMGILFFTDSLAFLSRYGTLIAFTP
jgi:cytochrome c-type biogenesis protein